MRFLSLFSGIEAASVAWHPLGWQCVGVAEIEPFPCTVLKHHYPTVPNLGNITTITREQVEALGHIDIVVGGFPCQDLSVAGKRAGLKNHDGSTTRSGLFFDAMRVVEWARARWLLIENVPGMLSNDSGRDFAAVVGEMAGCEFGVPPDGWENSGAAVGQIGLVEWATLDAQFFGLAQRRKRVFLVRDSGDWASREPVLLERQSMRGDPAPCRETGARTAATLTRGAESSGRGHAPPQPIAIQGSMLGRSETAGPAGPAGSGIGEDGISFTLTKTDVHGVLAFGGNNTAGPISVSSALSALSAHGGSGRMDFESETFVAHSLRADGFDASEDGTPLVPVLPFDTTTITSPESRSRADWGAPCHTLASGQHAPAIAFNARQDPINGPINGPIDTDGTTNGVAHGMRVRRLTPRECERLQGFPDNWTAIRRKHSKGEKDAADGSRYKALGNSMAVNVMQWIGQRIAAVA